jgi:hypothetical protein
LIHGGSLACAGLGCVDLRVYLKLENTVQNEELAILNFEELTF